MPLPPNPTYADLSSAFGTYGALAQASTVQQVDEEVPLGVFVMTEVNLEESGQGATMEIIGVDRSIRIQKAQWYDPYQIASGTSLSSAISLLLSDRWSDVETNFQSTTQTVPSTVLGLDSGGSSRDPWADALRLAQAGGFNLYFDGEGFAVLAPVPDPTDQTPVEVYEEGPEAMVLGVQRRISSDNTFNGVIVSGEGTSVRPPVRATAWDEDPASPTYRYGLFGERPAFISSPLVTSTVLAGQVAVAELAKLKGAEENVDWNQITDPSLDAGDVIQVTNTGTRLNKVLVIDKLSIPLAPTGSMRATARTLRVLTENA